MVCQLCLTWRGAREDLIVQETEDRRHLYCPTCGFEEQIMIKRTQAQKRDILERMPVAQKRKPEDKHSIRKLKRAS